MTKEQDYPPNTGQQETDEADDQMIDVSGEGESAADDADLLRVELSDLNERVLRLAAELENTRRRAEREKADASRYAIASFARDMLAVADNFERALDVAPEEGVANDETLSGFITGVRMTAKALDSVLERHGVRKINPKGEKFDPNLHQAVAQAPAPGVPSGFVCEVAQPGFVIGDRVLRAAMVIVSTGDGDPQGAGAHIDTSV
jgi:molecular chaperone GrpE